MPHILEGFKLAERTGISNRRLLIAMCIAIVVGTFASFWAFYHISYVEGARDWFAGRPFNRLQSWLTSPRAPDVPAIVAMCIGFLITGFLMIMRMRTLLVALSSRRIRYLQQLVNERILVFDFCEFRPQMDYSSARRCECTSKTDSVLPRSDFRRIHRWQCLEPHRHYNKSTDVPVFILTLISFLVVNAPSDYMPHTFLSRHRTINHTSSFDSG